MEKPILKLTTKDFLSGLGYGAHLGTGGIFFKADGVTPLFEAGSSQSVNNGLLMAGAAGTQVSGNLNGTIISSAQYTSASNTTFYFGTSTNHIFTLVADTTFSTSLTDAHTADTTLRQGMERLTDTSGFEWIFYFMTTKIGVIAPGSSFNDSWKSGINDDGIHCSHKFADTILFGNSGYVGQIVADADLSTSGGTNTNTTKLLIRPYGIATDISDDGTYWIIATTKNITCDTNAVGGCEILFYDGFSASSFIRQYHIQDPFIYALEKTSYGTFAFGLTGIWQVTLGGVKKIFNVPTGIYSVNANGALLYGRPATTAYSDALMWGGTSGSNKAIKVFGKLDGNAPTNYIHPFLSTASKNITLVDGKLLKGYVFVADDTPLLKAYPFSTANSPATGVTAQTVYFPLDVPIDVQKVRVTFGEPLASGDSLSVAVLSDEDTASVSFGTIAYDSNKTVRSKTLAPEIKVSCEDQLSLLLTFNGGAVKIKKIEVFGDVREYSNK